MMIASWGVSLLILIKHAVMMSICRLKRCAQSHLHLFVGQINHRSPDWRLVRKVLKICVEKLKINAALSHNLHI